MVLGPAWVRTVLDPRAPSGSSPSPYHFHSVQAGRAGKFNIPLHGYGTDWATAHALAVLNCIRENHAMYIWLPNSNSLSVMYILVQAGVGVSAATAVSITARYERLEQGIPTGVEISCSRLHALLHSLSTFAHET